MDTPEDIAGKERPLVIVVLGMAGSGKTTMVKSFYEYLKQKKKKIYSVNLDPAVLNVPYPVNIDIRDTIKYKDVMKNYGLGPNGAIMTSLNLFATRFDKVLTILEKRAKKLDYIIIDTPGQIEVFNWSASGTIILDTLAATFPTAIAYIVDTPRCCRPITFMSNMMYACSVLYKTRLPFCLIFNKTDVVSHQQCVEWMTDYESFQDVVLKESTYMASLSRSCALLLSEFYGGINSIGLSAVTTEGYNSLLSKFESCHAEYFSEFVPWMEKRKEEIEIRRKKIELHEASRLENDLRKIPRITKKNCEDAIKSVCKTMGRTDFDDDVKSEKKEVIESDVGIMDLNRCVEACNIESKINIDDIT